MTEQKDRPLQKLIAEWRQKTKSSLKLLEKETNTSYSQILKISSGDSRGSIWSAIRIAEFILGPVESRTFLGQHFPRALSYVKNTDTVAKVGLPNLLPAHMEPLLEAINQGNGFPVDALIAKFPTSGEDVLALATEIFDVRDGKIYLKELNAEVWNDSVCLLIIEFLLNRFIPNYRWNRYTVRYGNLNEDGLAAIDQEIEDFGSKLVEIFTSEKFKGHFRVGAASFVSVLGN